MRRGLEPAGSVADRAAAFARGGWKRLIHETNIGSQLEQIKNLKKSREGTGVSDRNNAEICFSEAPENASDCANLFCNACSTVSFS
jgi:hypothetical protein